MLSDGLPALDVSGHAATGSAVLGDLGIGRVESVWSSASGPERQIDELMERHAAAGADHAVRADLLEEYLRLAHSDDDGSGMFEVNAWTESLVGDYLALGRVEDAVRVVLEAGGRINWFPCAQQRSRRRDRRRTPARPRASGGRSTARNSSYWYSLTVTHSRSKGPTDRPPTTRCRPSWCGAGWMGG
jgi:hypothetical protein